jgi:hypothetical protein
MIPSLTKARLWIALALLWLLTVLPTVRVLCEGSVALMPPEEPAVERIDELPTLSATVDRSSKASPVHAAPLAVDERPFVITGALAPLALVLERAAASRMESRWISKERARAPPLPRVL